MDPAEALELAALAKQKPMLDAMAKGESEVQRFYKNSIIFLTGGSGFMGKQLMEKLLRCCHISRLYLLLRPKKGINIQTRMQKILNDPLFDKLKKEQPQFIEKIIAIQGNAAELKLGIQINDWNVITEEVDVIFHVAAITKFDENLRLATLTNVRGTREALLLGKTCKRLRSFVHVSTAFSHATEDKIGRKVKEIFYNCPIPPELIISMAEILDNDLLNSITSNVIKGWPNTYTFTKAIAEEQVRILSGGLPICIMRPAVVVNTYRDSNPGWLDDSCIYGGISFPLFCNLGAVHVSLMKSDCNIGIVPCDYVNNALIVAAKKTAMNQSKGGSNTKIYTITSTNRNIITFGKLRDFMTSQEARKILSPKSFYYIFASLTTSKTLFRILCWYFHDIPANVADFICHLMGKETKFGSLAQKYYKLSCTMSYFSLHEWNFLDDNLENLYNNLSEQDKAIFNFDITNIDWNEFNYLIIIGLRKYIYKDGLKDTEYASQKQKSLKIFNYFFITLYSYCLWKVTYLMYLLGRKGCNMTLKLVQILVPILKKKLSVIFQMYIKHPFIQ